MSNQTIRLVVWNVFRLNLKYGTKNFANKKYVEIKMLAQMWDEYYTWVKLLIECFSKIKIKKKITIRWNFKDRISLGI